MTDWRGLCAELVATLETHYPAETQGHYFTDDLCDVLDRTRAALAQPAPEADGDVGELVAWLRDRANSTSLAYAARRITRAADLLEKLSATTTSALAQPEPKGPTDEELLRLYGVATPCYHVDEYKRELAFARAAIALDRTRFGRPAIQPEERWYPGFADWLEREMPEGTVIGDPLWWASKIATYLQSHAYPAIEPVPVSERLPGPEDCDADGRCWWWDKDDDNLCLREHRPQILCWTHWLPHWALPVPTSQKNS